MPLFGIGADNRAKKINFVPLKKRREYIFSLLTFSFYHSKKGTDAVVWHRC